MSPIRREERARYPADWPEISARIRFGRAAGLCECVGQCGLEHHGRCAEEHGMPARWTRGDRAVRVVLTVAHLDHQPENCDEANLLAMCQPCHLRYDGPHHAQTRASRGDQTGELFA